MAMIISKKPVSFGGTNQPWMNMLITVPNFLRKLEHILWKPNIFFANIGKKIFSLEVEDMADPDSGFAFVVLDSTEIHYSSARLFCGN